MSDKNYAMGHAFSLHDTFMNFPVEKLKMTTEQCKETYSDGSKRDLAASIFARSVQEDGRFTSFGWPLYSIRRGSRRTRCRRENPEGCDD